MKHSKGIRRTTAAATMAAAALAGSGGLSSAQAADSDSFRVTTDSGCTVTTYWSNVKTAFKFFQDKGLTKKQAAGVVGNLIIESGVNPKQYQCNGPGRGIAQWEKGSRWDTNSGDNMIWYTKMAHQSSSWTLKAQLNFTWYELKKFPYYGKANLQKADTVKASAYAFMRDFERPKDLVVGPRYDQAKKVYAKYA